MLILFGLLVIFVSVFVRAYTSSAVDSLVNNINDLEDKLELLEAKLIGHTVRLNQVESHIAKTLFKEIKKQHKPVKVKTTKGAKDARIKVKK